MRVGEAIRLDRSDFDRRPGRPDRAGTPSSASPGMLPLHPTDGDRAWTRYAAAPRPAHVPRPRAPARCWLTSTGAPAALRNGTWETFAAAHRRAGLSRAALAAARGSTTCDILRGRHAARLVPRRRRRRRPGCRCCRPTSVTSTPATPTGTCRPPRNCWPWPPARLEAPRKQRHDDHARVHHAGVLHRAADPPAAGQPAHHRRLPRLAFRLLLAFAARQPGHSPPAWTSPTSTPR